MKRIFAAVKIDPQPPLIQFISKIKQHLTDSSIKWLETKNLHLTLKFFGETPDEKINEIEQALSVITIEPFEIEIGNLKIFGSRYSPRVIFLEALNAAPFRTLSQMINGQLEPLGFESDRQNFVPHLTLGRIKTIADKKYFQQTISLYSGEILQAQHIAEFHLFESILRPAGPEYNILKSFPFLLH